MPYEFVDRYNAILICGVSWMLFERLVMEGFITLVFIDGRDFYVRAELEGVRAFRIAHKKEWMEFRDRWL